MQWVLARSKFASIQKNSLYVRSEKQNLTQLKKKKKEERKSALGIVNFFHK